MLLTRYGLRTWGPLTIAAAAAVAVLAWLGWWWAIPPVAAAWLAVAWFFRDPARRIPTGLAAGACVSPADGTVSAVERIDEHEATGGPAVIVRIFLSVLNVHVNRAPRDGTVAALRHVPGKFLDARTEESARVNESNLVTMAVEGTRTIGVRQVAGKVARRIVCDLRVDDRLARGDRFGMIKFGSTTELILPEPDHVEVHVAVGDKVKGGVTVIATMSD